MSQNPVITYTVKSKLNGYVWLFKYNLNGSFISFEVLDSELSDKQILWLFAGANFPANEFLMQTVWMAKDLNKNFEVVKAAPILDFETFWKIYNLKIKKDAAEKAWNKLPDADKIKCFLAYPKYQKHLQQTTQAKAHLVTWINQKRYNDEL